MNNDDDPELMTYQRIGRLIRRTAGLSARARMLAMAMGYRANVDGAVIGVSVAELAAELECHPANVRRARAQLCEAGVLTMTDGGGRHRTNFYRFTIPLAPGRNPRGAARVVDNAKPAHQRAKPAHQRAETRAPARDLEELRGVATREEPAAPADDVPPPRPTAPPGWVRAAVGRGGVML